ncbi:hypothetical protein AVEN_191246-1 [Araneus ventricosus]|uniref:Uncharacterized protein n=1 Tax=Araneus ventricosus TaxID=182803 RepID=A0A4Y2GAV7_ARAVE|nr:hypothetical protein AVEN_191246-1 [Araneus ventricosus]
MCPKKCVTPHSGSVADRTDFLANSKKSTCKKRLKVEGGSSPIRPGPHWVQRTDLPYFCGGVRNNTTDISSQSSKLFISNDSPSVKMVSKSSQLAKIREELMSFSSYLQYEKQK